VMAEMLPLGTLAINLDRVEAIRLDQPRDRGPGKSHRIYFAVGATRYEDRSLSLDEDSDEGIALRRYVDGSEAEVVSIPVVPPHDPNKVVIQPLRVGPEMAALACGWDPTRHGVAEACTSLGEGGAA
jgi:hypothetical protein